MLIGLPQTPQVLTPPGAGGIGQCQNLVWGLEGDLPRIIWLYKFQTSNFNIFMMTKQFFKVDFIFHGMFLYF